MSQQQDLPFWMEASFKILDVRRSVIYPGEHKHSSKLPAATFLVVEAGQGQLYIDGVAHPFHDHYICHLGKGNALDIAKVLTTVHYYLIFYKAVSTVTTNESKLARSLPFGFIPTDFLTIQSLIERMHRQWQLQDSLERLHVRAMFHQLVYELLKQREDATSIHGIDLPTSAVSYMEMHYQKSINLTQLSEYLHCSPRQLQRQFKERWQISPLDYLTLIRMEHAQGLLLDTDLPIRQIAERVGYGDFYYFSRAFKKQIGISPLQYRRNRPSNLTQHAIGGHRLLSYSNNDDENHYQYYNEGDYVMKNQKLLTANLMLVLMLLLGACSGGNNAALPDQGNTNPPSASHTPPATNEVQSTSPAYPSTIAHLKGDLELEQKPMRIAVLDVQYIDQLVALQESPLGSVTAAGAIADFPDYLIDKLDGVQVLGTYQEPNLESIVALNPDLIICTDVHADIYDSLTKIAPTIMLERNLDWKDALLTFGQIMGKVEDAEQIISNYQEKTSQLAADLSNKLGEENVALIRPRDEMIRIHTADHRTGAVLYQDLGLNVPPLVAKEEGSYHITLEGLTELDADHYFLLTDDMFSQLVKEMKDTTTWQSLEAVANDHVYTVDTTMWIGYYGPIAINLIVDQVADLLLGNE